MPQTSPFPPSLPPDLETQEDDLGSESGMHAVVPTVALAVVDEALLERLSTLMLRNGRVSGGDDLIPVAIAVVADAPAGARQAVARIRARARSDAAILVVLAPTASEDEAGAAYDAGALLCLRAPIDEHQILSAIGSAIDLRTAKVRADDLMRQLDVQSHLASLGRVTAGFTHEMANPLAALSANFAAVRESVDGLLQARELLAPLTPAAARTASERMARVAPGEVREALGDMQTAIDRLTGVLATVRGLAQGARSGRLEGVDLAAVVRDVRRWAATEIRGVDIQELVEEPLVAQADPRLLRQIVLNLVTNAAHAARQLPSPRVRLHVYASGDAAILSVRDNGPGVPPELRDRIYEPFFTTRRGQGGTGLGLALCREYAAQMNAQLSLWTAPGRGACFRIHMRRGLDAVRET